MSQKVLVTGATGHLGQTLCRLLIDNGYEVIAGVRKKTGDVRASRLMAMGAELLELDVLQPKLLQNCLQGIQGIFHLAAVYQFAGNYSSQMIKDTAINGTLNVLTAAKNAGVAHVVMTSSTVAVGSDTVNGNQLDESNWNTNTHEPYAIAKTYAELEAFKFSEQHDLQINTICPAAIIGPNFENHTPTTLPIELAMTGGLKAIPPLSFSFVDVRDVALAHLLAYEKSSKSSRYIASGNFKTMAEMVDAIKNIDPDLKTPNFLLPKLLLPLVPQLDWLSNALFGTPRFATRDFINEFGNTEPRFSTEKIERDLNWSARPFEQSIEDTVNWIKKKQNSVKPQVVYS